MVYDHSQKSKGFEDKVSGKLALCVLMALVLAVSLALQVATAPEALAASSSGPKLVLKSGKHITVKKGASAKVKVKAEKGATVSYKSSKKSVATVSAKGVVKAKQPGKATITVRAKKAGKTSTCKVFVKVVASKSDDPTGSHSAEKVEVRTQENDTIYWPCVLEHDPNLAYTQALVQYDLPAGADMSTVRVKAFYPDGTSAILVDAPAGFDPQQRLIDRSAQYVASGEEIPSGVKCVTIAYSGAPWLGHGEGDARIEVSWEEISLFEVA